MTEQRVVRVAGPGELVQAVPYLLGYRPRESLVVLELAGPRQRVGATACVPLPPRERLDLADEVVHAALGPLLVEGVERVLVVVYVRRRPSSTGALPERAVVRAVRRLAESEGVAVADEVAVWDDRWWSYRCSDPRCCPPAGTPVVSRGGPAAVVTELVLEGAAPVESREALAATLAPSAAELPGLDDAIARVRGQSARWLGPVAERAALRALGRLLDAASGEPGAGAARGATEACAVDDAALVLVGLRDVRVRDAAVCLVADAEQHGATRLLQHLVRGAPPGQVAPPATLLAVRAYLSGNGALANVALERALAAEPGYALAQLLAGLLAAGTHPRVVRELVEDVRAEVMPTTA